MKRLGVGRPLLREAIVALLAGGQLVAKPGTGLFLLEDPALDWSPTESSADLGPSIIEQLETRLLVECELVERAAGLITSADLARLEALVAEMQANDPVDDPRLGIEFHVTIARASGRKILAALVEAIFDLRQGPMWKTLRQQMLRPEHYRRTIADRVAILKALKAADGIAAREAMRTMLEVVRYRFFEEQGGASADEPVAERV
jgi:DNA-binding FadR family transcriptional regulator